VVPWGIQVVFYAAVVVLLVLGMKLFGGQGKRAKTGTASPSPQQATAG
jgi:hypothetical protein